MITVTTRDELVEALKGDEGYIELRGKDFGWVDVHRDVTLIALDTSTVTLWAYGTSTVTLWAYDTSTVNLIAYGSSTVYLNAYDTSTVYLNAYDTSTVTLIALDTSKVTLIALDTSTVTLWAYGTSTVTLWAYDTSTVNLIASGTSTITEEFIGENVTINEWNGAKYVTRTKESEISGDTTDTEPTTRQPEPCANDGCKELIWEYVPGIFQHIARAPTQSGWTWVCGEDDSARSCAPLATTPRVATPRKGE